MTNTLIKQIAKIEEAILAEDKDRARNLTLQLQDQLQGATPDEIAAAAPSKNEGITLEEMAQFGRDAVTVARRGARFLRWLAEK